MESEKVVTTLNLDNEVDKVVVSHLENGTRKQVPVILNQVVIAKGQTLGETLARLNYQIEVLKKYNDEMTAKYLELRQSMVDVLRVQEKMMETINAINEKLNLEGRL